MSLTARVTYTNDSFVDIAAQTHDRWYARIDLRRPYPAGASLSQAYQSQLQLRRNPEPEPLTDELTVTAATLDGARDLAATAIEALTGLSAYSTRFIDLREYNASPAACEEFKVAKEQRKAA